MKAIAIVGGTNQPETLLADLLHWHGLSVFQVDSGDTLLPLLSFISPELIIVESDSAAEVASVCDLIERSSVVGRVPLLVCSDCGTVPAAADVHLSGAYTAEDVFAYIQALRPLGTSLSNRIATSAWVDS